MYFRTDPQKFRSLIVALLGVSLYVNAAFSQCVVTPIPVGDGSNNSFTTSVDLDGDIAVISDITDDPLGTWSGSVEVRRFDGSVWLEEAILTASNGVAQDRFGIQVAVSGNVIAVGSRTDDGVVYMFRYNITTMVWEEEAILTLQLEDIGTKFGSNLALDGDVVAIHGSMLNGLGEDINGAHFFRYNPTTFTWDFEQAVAIDDPRVGAWFPNLWMALDGDVLIAGEPTVTRTGKGGAWIYRYDGATWNLDVRIPSPTTTSVDNDFFGLGVDILGDMAVIGAPFDADIPSGGTTGAVYVYEYDGANWNFTQKVVPADSGQNEGLGFGWAMSLATDTLLVGNSGADDPVTMAVDAGAVYRFERQGAAWVEQGLMFAPDSMTDDFLSFNGLTISGDRAIISSARKNDATGLGKAYIVEGVRGIGSPDCNSNGIPDYCDILDFTSDDANLNGIPDECECRADTDGSGSVNVTDLLVMLAEWGDCPVACQSDSNSDGQVNVTDLLTLLSEWGTCP